MPERTEASLNHERRKLTAMLITARREVQRIDKYLFELQHSISHGDADDLYYIQRELRRIDIGLLEASPPSEYNPVGPFAP